MGARLYTYLAQNLKDNKSNSVKDTHLTPVPEPHTFPSAVTIAIEFLGLTLHLMNSYTVTHTTHISCFSMARTFYFSSIIKTNCRSRYQSQNKGLTDAFSLKKITQNIYFFSASDVQLHTLNKTHIPLCFGLSTLGKI